MVWKQISLVWVIQFEQKKMIVNTLPCAFYVGVFVWGEGGGLQHPKQSPLPSKLILSVGFNPLMSWIINNYTLYWQNCLSVEIEFLNF